MDKIDRATNATENISQGASQAPSVRAVSHRASGGSAASSPETGDTVFEMGADPDLSERETEPDSSLSSVPWDTDFASPFEAEAASELAAAGSVAESNPPGDPAAPPPQSATPTPARPNWEPSPSRLRWTQPETPAHELSTRRTGVAFLSLILTTNSIPWMQLAQRSTATSELLPSSQALVVVLTCLVAAVMVILAWFFGRRLPLNWGPRIESPRDSGLMLAVVAAGLNLGLAAIIRWNGAETRSSFLFFSILWFVLVVPTQIGAAFCKGRASIPFAIPKVPAPQKAPVSVAARRSTLERRRNTAK